MPIYRENPIYTEIEEPLYPHGSGNPPIYSVPRRNRAFASRPLYSTPHRTREPPEIVTYPAVYTTIYQRRAPSPRQQTEGRASSRCSSRNEESTARGGERGGRRKIRYTKTKVTMSVKRRPDGDRPPPPKRLQSRWNPTLVKWTQTVKYSTPQECSASSGRAERGRQSGSGSRAQSRSGSRSGSREGGSVRTDNEDQSVETGTQGDSEGGKKIKVCETTERPAGRGRPPFRSSSMRASAICSPDRDSGPTTTPSPSRGSELRRSKSLKSDHEPGYQEQVQQLRHRLLTRLAASAAALVPLSSRRPSDVLLHARKPVTENVFTVLDRSEMVDKYDDVVVDDGATGRDEEDAWTCIYDRNVDGVHIEEIRDDADDGSDLNKHQQPKSIDMLEHRPQSIDDRRAGAFEGPSQRPASAALSYDDSGCLTVPELVGVFEAAKEEEERHLEVDAPKSHEEREIRRCISESQEPELLEMEEKVHESRSEKNSEKVEQPVKEEKTSSEDPLLCGEPEIRRSRVNLAAEEGGMKRTLDVQVAYSPAAREILHLDGRVRETVEAIEAAEFAHASGQFGVISGQFDDTGYDEKCAMEGVSKDYDVETMGDRDIERYEKLIWDSPAREEQFKDPQAETIDVGKIQSNVKDEQGTTKVDVDDSGSRKQSSKQSTGLLQGSKHSNSDFGSKRDQSPPTKRTNQTTSHSSPSRRRRLPTGIKSAELSEHVPKSRHEDASDSSPTSAPSQRRIQNRRSGQRPISDSDGEEEMRRRERGWNAPRAPRSKSLPRSARESKTDGKSTSGKQKSKSGRDKSDKSAVGVRSMSSPPPSSPDKKDGSSKASSLCSSSVSSPSKSTVKSWRHTIFGRGRSRTTRRGENSDGMKKKRVYNPPSSLARPSPRQTTGHPMRPALSSPSLVARSSAASTIASSYARPTFASSHGRTGTLHAHHATAHSQHGQNRTSPAGGRAVARSGSFTSSRAAPVQRGRPVVRASSMRAPGALFGYPARSEVVYPSPPDSSLPSLGSTCRGAHAASHARTDQPRTLSPYRSRTLPRTLHRPDASADNSPRRSESFQSPRKQTSVASSPRRSESSHTPRQVHSTSTETGYDSMESPPLRKHRRYMSCTYIPMLKTRRNFAEIVLRGPGSPPRGVAKTLRHKFENLDALIAAAQSDQNRRRWKSLRRETSPVRETIDHFEKLRSSLSSPDLDMKSPPLVREYSSSVSKDLNQLEQQIQPVPKAPRRPLSISLESLRSIREISPSPYLDPFKYRQYVLKLLRSSRKSPHFQRLKRHYHSLEKLMELERLTEVYSHPGYRGFPTYEAWRSIRAKEKALTEMKRICEQLEEAQRRREFYSRFSSRCSERWHGDRSLQRRQKSVEDLKRKFDEICEKEAAEQKDFTLNRPLHKTTEQSDKGVEPCSKVRRSLSSLSTRQMETLKGRLNGIYGSQSSIHSTRSQSEPRHFVDISRVAPPSSSKVVPTLRVRPASEPEAGVGSGVSPKPKSLPARPGSVHQMRCVQDTDAIPETEKRRMSLALSREVANRFAPKDRREQRSKSASPAASAASPRTCYSVDLSQEGERLADAQEFMLVLTPDREMPKPSLGKVKVTQSLTRYSTGISWQERRQLIERSERLRERRMARLKRPLSSPYSITDVPLKSNTLQEQQASDYERHSSQSSVQTVVEKKTPPATQTDVPHAVYHWEREAMAAAAAAGEHGSPRASAAASPRGSVRSISAPSRAEEAEDRFRSLPCPVRQPSNSRRRRYLSPDYVPERSASSVELNRPKGEMGENDVLQYENDFQYAFDTDYARSRSVSPVGRGWSYSPPRRRSSCSPPRRYGPPVRIPSSSPTREGERYSHSTRSLPQSVHRPTLGSSPPRSEAHRIRARVEPGRYLPDQLPRRPVPTPRLSKASSLPHLARQPHGTVRSLAQQFEEASERDSARSRSWSPPRNLRQLGAYISRTKILSKIVELQRRLRRPTTEKEELDHLRSFVERERETLRRVRRGEVDRLKRQLHRGETSPGRSVSSPSLVARASPTERFSKTLARVNVMSERGGGGTMTSERGREPARQFRPISSQSAEETPCFSASPLITSTPLPCSPPMRATRSTPSPRTANHRPSTWAGEPRDWSIHRPVGRYVPPTRSASATCRKPVQTGFQPYAVGRRWHCDGCAIRAYQRWRNRKRNVTWQVSPHRPRDDRDAAAGEQWRAQSANRLVEEERRRRHLQELEQLERRRHGDNFTPSQKSPIPLNRYQNLFDDVTIRSNRGSDAKMAARALHSFRPINNRELSFNRGDVIYIRRQVDRNWLEGELHGRIGIFPINYVEVVPVDSPRQGQPRVSSEGQARARYAFEAQTPVELSLKKGDLVTLIRRVDSNWFEGRLGQKVGIFPASYVEVLGKPLPQRIETSAKPVGTPAAHGLTSGATSGPGGDTRNQLHVDTSQPEAVPYKSLYNYAPQNDDELELREGDVVYVIEKCEDGWYVGTNHGSGMFGTFPGNYVQKM